MGCVCVCGGGVFLHMAELETLRRESLAGIAILASAPATTMNVHEFLRYSCPSANI